MEAGGGDAEGVEGGEGSVEDRVGVGDEVAGGGEVGVDGAKRSDGGGLVGEEVDGVDARMERAGVGEGAKAAGEVSSGVVVLHEAEAEGAPEVSREAESGGGAGKLGGGGLGGG